jgi:hypothetical protein
MRVWRKETEATLFGDDDTRSLVEDFNNIGV